MNFQKKTLSGWGNVLLVKANTVRPEFLSDLPSIIKNKSDSFIAYGCGRSYGDAALNNNGITILTSRLNRFIFFDAEQNTLICESGVTLHDIQHTFLPRGVGLITSPGTAWVTVGGAIANDVHGKNHDRVGSFGNQVRWFDLLLASGEIIRCSREQHKAVFFATIGGLGLTGIITTVCLQLQKQSMTVRVKNEFISTIPTLLSRLRNVRDTATYSVAWLDLISKKNAGRSILSTAEPLFSPLENTEKSSFFPFENTATHLFSPFEKGGLRGILYNIFSPILFRSFFLNRFSIRIINQLHYSRAQKKEKSFSQPLLAFLYPLDAIKNWNRLYRKGFYQFQCIIPDQVADAGITEIINEIKKSSQRCYLAVLKTVGSEGEGLLSFPQRGFTLALDFPNQKNILFFLKKLESVVLKYQGRIYLAKDACLSAAGFSAMYPNLSEFQAVLKMVDPHKQWQSALSKRLLI